MRFSAGSRTCVYQRLSTSRLVLSYLWNKVLVDLVITSGLDSTNLCFQLDKLSLFSFNILFQLWLINVRLQRYEHDIAVIGCVPQYWGEVTLFQQEVT